MEETTVSSRDGVKKRSELRRQAEAVLQAKTAHRPNRPPALSAEAALRAVHELSVHQIELEMQNEELRRTMEALERLAQIHAAMHHANVAIAQSSSAEVLQDRICQAMVESGPFKVAWIGWYDPVVQWIRIVSTSGDKAGGLEGLRIGSAGAAPGMGGGDTAFRDGRASVVNDFLGSASTTPWHRLAELAGIASSASLPLRKRGEFQGVLSVYSSSKDFFGARELQLLGEVAETLSFALDRLELDIHHRQAEEELMRSKSRLRTLIDTLPDLVWLKDANGVYLACNPRFELFFGAKEAEIIGRTDHDFVEEGLARFFREMDKAAMTAGRPVSNEERITFASDGHQEDLETIKTPIFDADGNTSGILGIGRNITERKAAEASLRESKAYLENLIDFANAPIIVWDPEFRITRFNHAFEALTGRSEAEVLGRSLEILFPPQLAVSYMELIRRTLTGERWETVEILILHLDGTVRTVLWNSATLFKPDGRTPVSTIAQGQDISERKAAYDRLSELNVKLRALTLELTQTERRERTRLAQLLHDHLQQQLVGATFNIETLRGQIKAEAGQKTLEKLSDAVRHAINVSRDLTMQLSPPVFHEKGLAGGLEWLGRQAHRNYGLTVSLELDRTLEPDTEAVRMFLFEAVRELLLNAAKHAKVKEARVSMGPLGPGEMKITVEDNGVGFDPAKLELDASLAEGLGLFSIRERLNFLMGRLEISSSPGCGSTFTLVVPVHGLAETPPPPPPVETIARRTERGPRNADQNSHRG